MSIKLLNEVWDHAPADWTQTERLFVAVLAEKARDSTRRSWPGQATIARRTGLKGESITRLCHRLAVKGWELREQQGVDRNGKPVFAYRGQSAVYVIPAMCPMGKHDPDVCFPTKGRTIVRPFSDEATDPVESLEGDSEGEESPESTDDGPVIPEERADDSPVIDPATPDHRPPFLGKGRTVVRERADGGPPLTVNEPSNFNPQPDARHAEPATPPSVDPTRVQTPIPPQRTVAQWSTFDRKPSPSPTVNSKPRTPRQQTLFSKNEARLPQATQVVLDGLKAAGHTNVTADDARAVHTAVCARYGAKVNLTWLRTMASNRSFEPFLNDIRAARAETVEAQILDLQRTNPDCEHGTAAGNLPHPTTGDLLCPWCRNGTTRPADIDQDRTHPAIAAAVTVYRETSNRRLGVADLLNITQQATVLHRRGCTAEQLADYARNAATNQCGLLEAATAQ